MCIYIYIYIYIYLYKYVYMFAYMLEGSIYALAYTISASSLKLCSAQFKC